MTSMLVPPLMPHVAPGMARADSGPSAASATSHFAAELKAQADRAIPLPGPDGAPPQAVPAASLPRPPDVDALLVQLFACRKMTLTATSKTGRSLPAPSTGRATVPDCMSAGEDGLDHADAVDGTCAAERAQDLPAWQAAHCPDGFVYGGPFECGWLSTATAVGLPTHTIIWVAVDAPRIATLTPTPPAYARPRRRQAPRSRDGYRHHQAVNDIDDDVR
nr:hypothetical protein [uncultured Massilia sp.]